MFIILSGAKYLKTLLIRNLETLHTTSIRMPRQSRVNSAANRIRSTVDRIRSTVDRLRRTLTRIRRNLTIVL